ncbi:NADH-quinone oxidoreductase subunit NuoG [Methylophaga sp. OBS4]|uniref:NADH-quinone oxidoreductase subunit NuoG n=1 Tax=Methylophaga sp. OBS4 TaxID=2991935 RepID=UPI00224D32C0|nr:NADH-quinone oxidoreductase subunit NuoG [Methylophaga sp. OBS4]MCX4188500.1 NADH-quinone oxidoreductase subunit NuoG [Methylophaga sp. OBS4]
MVNIEIDGIPLKVDATKMIIQAADEAGIDIPRFCYHKKLSIAANCRMCLVEVDKARKAMPACATPVSEGMKVFTHSKVAVNAQRSVMEFLLINHPLDCPICDQGGECELQDLSMGYGEGVSRFTERKRVVKDKNIGPLIQTDMTRCIHCTRCVRFGQEIAGIKELGATGRGEHTEIGTYVEHSLVSELSGNIIDLCPVGALTSKPFRYKARAWELTAHPSIAPHDAVGSNIELHVSRNEVMRVVPRDNEAVNEAWLSDRDRFSYLGLTHQDRALQPMIKVDGEWQTVAWQTALETAVDGLKTLINKHGAGEVGGLISPTATLEEAFLFQKWLRGLGTDNIDHRLRQQDFADAAADYSVNDWALADIEDSDAILLLGTNIRAEQPIIAHRIRQAALAGCVVTDINFFINELLMPVERQLAEDAGGLISTLAGVAKALTAVSVEGAEKWLELLPERSPTAFEQNVALQLSNAMNATLFVGDLINHHPHSSKMRALAALIARLSESRLIILPAANSNGHMIAATVPQQGGLNAAQMWQRALRAYVLMGVEPLLDTANPAAVRQSLQRASFVVALNSFVSDTILEYADVILPVASFVETSGTFVGIDQQWQRFAGAVQPRGDSRPGWKILRVLGNVSKLKGFDYISSQDIIDELQIWQKISNKKISVSFVPESLAVETGLMMISEVPMYRSDSLLRHSNALQQTPENKAAAVARINQKEADSHKLSVQQPVVITQDDKQISLPLQIDNDIADGCIYVAAATEFSALLGNMFGLVSVSPAGGEQT